MTDVTENQGRAEAELSAADEQVLRELTERARAGGLKLTGEGGLLGRLTKMVIEGALEGELDDHLGYGKHDPEGRDGGNSRNGHRVKTVLTDTGPVEISVPRDRDSSFDPKIVAKRQRRLTGVDDMVISLSAKGLTHGEIAAHLEEIYGAEVSKQTISTITDRVMDGMAEWQSRPLDPAVYAVIFIDAIRVKIREGQVANRPVYLALGVTADGERDVLGLWAGEHGDGEGAKFWLRVLSEIKNRGTRDVLMVVCDGLKGLPDSVNSVWEKTIVQTCIVHLLRNSFKYASKRDWAAIAKDIKPVYTAVSEAAALDAFAEFSGKWEHRYPAIIKLWENAWAEFVPFLRFDREIRTVICTTNAIESINARLRRAVNARGHFPTEQAALKCLYLALMSLDPTGKGRKRWTNRWKAALNAFDLTFDGRLSAGR
jgi:putative transposase